MRIRQTVRLIRLVHASLLALEMLQEVSLVQLVRMKDLHPDHRLLLLAVRLACHRTRVDCSPKRCGGEDYSYPLRARICDEGFSKF